MQTFQTYMVTQVERKSSCSAYSTCSECSAHLHDPDGMVRLADADNAMKDGLLHDVEVRLGCAQTVCQPILVLPFLHCTYCTSHTPNMCIGSELLPACISLGMWGFVKRVRNRHQEGVKEGAGGGRRGGAGGCCPFKVLSLVGACLPDLSNAQWRTIPANLSAISKWGMTFSNFDCCYYPLKPLQGVVCGTGAQGIMLECALQPMCELGDVRTDGAS